jgi:mannosyl-oligosaccharide alpha-1,2-mannosidase
LAELGSCQLEYKYLSHVTGKEDYFQKASIIFFGNLAALDLVFHLQPDHIVDLMRDGQVGTNGMWDIMWDISSGKQLNSQYHSLVGIPIQIPTYFFTRSCRGGGGG